VNVHPAAAIFPEMADRELGRLTEDVRRRGLLVPILLDADGRIVDGRNRLRACREAGAEPRFETWDGDGSAVDLVLSLNLRRRHLTPSQAAAAAAEALPLYEAEAKERQREHGGTAPGRRNTSGTSAGSDSREREARAQAARAFGVSPRYVSDAKRLQSERPAAFEAVRRGDLPLSRAARDLRRDDRMAELAERCAEPLELGALPRFPVVLADPPWRYERTDGMGEGRAAENHYRTMPLAEIQALDVPAAEDAALFLWVPPPLVAWGVDAARAWGFEVRSGLVWVKPSPGPGKYVRQQHELLLVAARGAMPTPHPGDRPSSVFEAPRGAHSEKPEAAYALVERMYPGLPKVELFARRSRPGWCAWGDEVPVDVAPPGSRTI